MSYEEDVALRLKILSHLRELKIQNKDNTKMGTLSEGVNSEFLTVERVCAELEEEDLVKYTSQVTSRWGVERIRKGRTIAITSLGRQELHSNSSSDVAITSSIQAGGDVTINMASDSSQLIAGDNANTRSQSTNISDSANVATGDGNAQAYSDTDGEAKTTRVVFWSVVAGLITAGILGISKWLYEM